MVADQNLLHRDFICEFFSVLFGRAGSKTGIGSKGRLPESPLPARQTTAVDLFSTRQVIRGVRVEVRGFLNGNGHQLLVGCSGVENLLSPNRGPSANHPPP